MLRRLRLRRRALLRGLSMRLVGRRVTGGASTTGTPRVLGVARRRGRLLRNALTADRGILLLGLLDSGRSGGRSRSALLGSSGNLGVVCGRSGSSLPWGLLGGSGSSRGGGRGSCWGGSGGSLVASLLGLHLHLHGVLLLLEHLIVQLWILRSHSPRIHHRILLPLVELLLLSLR